MARRGALSIKPGTTRELLLEFVVPSGPTGDGESVARITEAVKNLGLRADMIGQIESAVVKAIRMANDGTARARYNPSMYLQVWLVAQPTRDVSNPSSEAQEVRPKGGGWGFFLLERQEDQVQATGAGAPRFIELCLYQECAVRAATSAAERLDLV